MDTPMNTAAVATRSRHARLLCSIAAVGFALFANSGIAAGVADIAADTQLFLDRQTLALPGDVEITVGEPDARLDLAQCRRYEPFIPTGARLWGRTTLGVR